MEIVYKSFYVSFITNKLTNKSCSLMKNSLNNVDRGMNVAVVDGKTGHLEKIGVFDLYSEGCILAYKLLKTLCMVQFLNSLRF